MKTENLNHKIRSYPPLTHAEDLAQICKPLEKLNIHYFAQVKIDQNNHFSAIGMKPEFAKLYLEKEYYNFDIHMAKTEGERSYILWDLINVDKQSLALQEDCQGHNINHLFTIVQVGNKNKEYFHFATEANLPSINNRYLQNLDVLNRFILYFKDKISSHKSLAKSHDYKFSISDQKANFYTQTESVALDPSNLMQEFSLTRIAFNDQGDYLTHREFECLHWLSLAKTIDQIALLLNITTRTVNAHIANIKEKTGCYTLFQLGALYQKLGGRQAGGRSLLDT